MTSVLGRIGYGPVESLYFFVSRFSDQCTFVAMDEELKNVWISHRSIQNLKNFQLGFTDDHFKTECNKIHSKLYTQTDVALVENTEKEFSPSRIIDRILTKLHCCLAQYIISECLVLYNWGVNSFELVLENEELSARLCKNQNNYKRKRAFGNDEGDFRKWRMILTSQRKNVNQEKMRRNSTDLFDEEERKIVRGNKKGKRKRSDYRKLAKIYKEFDTPLGELPWGKGSNLDIFNKDRILYDMRQRSWPTNHPLSSSTSDELLQAIMKVEIKEERNNKIELTPDMWLQWKTLHRIVGLILKNHKALAAFDGYGRLLKHHLKITGFSRGNAASRTLKPIPSNSVSSYIAIILHKVVPLEFFGSNRPRKNFFRETSRIVNGGKSENFIFKPLIQTLENVKNNLPWILEIQDPVVARRVIVKIVKWLLLDYILLILKNHFYITDVGSSGYRLYYYRKNDVEGATTRWVNNQIRAGNLRRVNGNLDHWTSVERMWLETGKIEYNGKERKMMPERTSYIYPVANVRFLPKTGENSDLRLITSYRIKRTPLRNEDCEKKKLREFFMRRHVVRLLTFRRIKLFLRFLADKYGSGIKPLPNNPKLDLAWAKAAWLKQTHGKLYYVKADVSDAFGSVLPSLLGAIIEEKLRVKSNQVLQLKKIKECRARDGRIECGIRKGFSDKPMENSLLISRSIFVGVRKKLPSFCSDKIKKILDQIIQNRYLRINGKIYRLLKGLTQGSSGSISPLLCDLYYSEMDRVHFKEFTSCSKTVLLRAVDDYLLLTSDIEKARKFYDIVFNGVKDFNVTFNRSKLKTNINDSSLSRVSYLGLTFDVGDTTVRPDYERYITKDLLSTMKLSDPYGSMFTRRIQFITFRSLGIVPLKLMPVTLNWVYNPATVIREIVYSACVVQSNRILALVRHLTRCNEKNDLDVCVILSETLRKIAAVVTRLNRHVTKLEISWLFWRAASAVFGKYSGVYPSSLAVVRHRVNLAERHLRKRGCDQLLDSIKREMARGESWRELHKMLKVITAKSKPSRRFR